MTSHHLHCIFSFQCTQKMFTVYLCLCLYHHNYKLQPREMIIDPREMFVLVMISMIVHFELIQHLFKFYSIGRVYLYSGTETSKMHFCTYVKWIHWRTIHMLVNKLLVWPFIILLIPYIHNISASVVQNKTKIIHYRDRDRLLY